MGILRDEDKPKIRIEDVDADIDYNDYVFDDDDFVILSLGESEEEEFPPVNPAHKIAYEHRFNRRMAKYAARKANRAPPCGGSVDGVNIKPNMGANKWRRIENARILASFCDPSDIRYDCSDLIVETVSVFRRLMENEESMRVWNEFIEKDEKEQQTFLKELEDGINDISFCDDLETSSDEKRAHHPAYSAKNAFMRLDKKFRSALSKRGSVRLDLIEELENEFREFFSHNPRGNWSKIITSNQKRFYLHAVCQFLLLESKSRQTHTNQLITEVHNPRKKFEPPHEPLHAYLHKKFHRTAQIAH